MIHNQWMKMKMKNKIKKNIFLKNNMAFIDPNRSPDKPEWNFSNIRGKGETNEEDFNLQRVNKYMIAENAIDRSAGIILSETQQEWYKKVLEILNDNRIYIDTSEMGSGKTFIVLMLALTLELPLFIICPPSIEGVWRNECKNYAVPLAGVIGYQSLRSITHKQPKHRYLTREENFIDTGIKNKKTGKNIIINDPRFFPTEKFADLVRSGILLIFDEFQMIKNNTAQFKSAYGLIKGLDALGSRSRIGLLSATPIDKTKQSINLFYILGFIKTDDPLNSVYDLINECVDINAAKTNKIALHYGFNMQGAAKKKLKDEDRENVENMIFDLYVALIKNNISGYIEPTRMQYTFRGDEILQLLKAVENLDLDRIAELKAELEQEQIINDIQNGNYNLSPAGYRKLAAAVDNANEAGAFIKEKGGRVIMAKMGKMTLAEKAVELAKIEIFCRIGLETLLADVKNKIIFCVNYRQTILSLGEFFKDYEPLKFDGSVKKENRAAIIATFNNDPTRRILICNIEVGGVGISLHDKVGNSPRFMFISPSYKMLSIHQATGRIYRKGVRSNATTRLVFGNGLEETRVKNNLKKKSEILRESLLNKDVLLPDQYPDYIEPVRKGGIKFDFKFTIKQKPGKKASGQKGKVEVEDETEAEDEESEAEADGEDAYLDVLEEDLEGEE